VGTYSCTVLRALTGNPHLRVLWKRHSHLDITPVMRTFAIITVEPNELVLQKTSHDRMPLIGGWFSRSGGGIRIPDDLLPSGLARQVQPTIYEAK
jgi:hypothetical protein